ncbi:MAG: putative porin [Gammaproteobacteria bacterium]|nr:putative porin [Gammaproteobacteria bacterium]
MKTTMLLLLTMLVFAYALPARAGDVDLLIEKLVSKGILTQSDAEEITAEIASEAQAVESTLVVQDMQAMPAPRAAATAGSGWWERIKLKGDLRVRYQDESLDNAPTVGDLDIDDQDRWRIRWRAGALANVNEHWEVGFGLTSGGADGRSTNQTLRRGFSTGDARLDYAYTKFAATEHVDVLAGKFKNPLWTPKDLLWDSDLRPEGVAVPMEFTLADTIEAFVTPAYLVLSESVSGSRDDISMLVLQAGATFDLSDTVSLKLAPAYYNFSGLEGSAGPVGLDVPSNSRDIDGNLVNDYDAITLAGQLSITGTELVPKVSIFGEFVNAFDPSDDETGWLAGFSFGDAKVSGAGDWQFKYNYRRLEADAWPEFLADSDLFFGATNTKGSELEFVWGLARGVNVSLDYYSGAEFLGTDIEQDLLQLDLNLKW